jgi:hypothetical protein
MALVSAGGKEPAGSVFLPASTGDCKESVSKTVQFPQRRDRFEQLLQPLLLGRRQALRIALEFPHRGSKQKKGDAALFAASEMSCVPFLLPFRKKRWKSTSFFCPYLLVGVQSTMSLGSAASMAVSFRLSDAM